MAAIGRHRLVPGERRLGLVMNQSVRDNILLPSLGRLTGEGGSAARVAASWSPN